MSESPGSPPNAAANTDTDRCVMEGTTRDKVWDATLDLIIHRPIPFQAWRIRERAGLDRSHDRTIRRTLTAMADAGWLEHEQNSKWWYLGPKANAHLK